MEELTHLLNNIADSYYDFTKAVLCYSEKKQSRLDTVMEYLLHNPNALSSDVLAFISEQADFYEDAAYVKVS